MTAKHIRLLGRAIFFGGLIAAALIYFTAGPDRRLGILGIDIRTNRQRGQLERMGGKNYVLFNDFHDWFVSLWQGRQLAYTVGVLSALGYLVCRGLARVHEDHEQEIASDATKRAKESFSRAEIRPASEKPKEAPTTVIEKQG